MLSANSTSPMLFLSRTHQSAQPQLQRPEGFGRGAASYVAAACVAKNLPNERTLRWLSPCFPPDNAFALMKAARAVPLRATVATAAKTSKRLNEAGRPAGAGGPLEQQLPCSQAGTTAKQHHLRLSPPPTKEVVLLFLLNPPLRCTLLRNES